MGRGWEHDIWVGDRSLGTELIPGRFDSHQDALGASAGEIPSSCSGRAEPYTSHLNHFTLHLTQTGECSRIECVGATETLISLLSNRQHFRTCVVSQGECFAVSPLHIMRGHLIE